MNWVGGARNRVKFQGDRRLQKEFFERKKLDLKRGQLQKPAHHKKRKKKISQDLVALQTVNSASCAKVDSGPRRGPNVQHIDLDHRRMSLSGRRGELPAVPLGSGARSAIHRRPERVDLPFSPDHHPSRLHLIEIQTPSFPKATTSGRAEHRVGDEDITNPFVLHSKTKPSINRRLERGSHSSSQPSPSTTLLIHNERQQPAQSFRETPLSSMPQKYFGSGSLLELGLLPPAKYHGVQTSRYVAKTHQQDQDLQGFHDTRPVKNPWPPPLEHRQTHARIDTQEVSQAQMCDSQVSQAYSRPSHPYSPLVDFPMSQMRAVNDQKTDTRESSRRRTDSNPFLSADSRPNQPILSGAENHLTVRAQTPQTQRPHKAQLLRRNIWLRDDIEEPSESRVDKRDPPSNLSKWPRPSPSVSLTHYVTYSQGDTSSHAMETDDCQLLAEGTSRKRHVSPQLLPAEPSVYGRSKATPKTTNKFEILNSRGAPESIRSVKRPSPRESPSLRKPFSSSGSDSVQSRFTAREKGRSELNDLWLPEDFQPSPASSSSHILRNDQPPPSRSSSFSVGFHRPNISKWNCFLGCTDENQTPPNCARPHCISHTPSSSINIGGELEDKMAILNRNNSARVMDRNMSPVTRRSRSKSDSSTFSEDSQIRMSKESSVQGDSRMVSMLQPFSETQSIVLQKSSTSRTEVSYKKYVDSAHGRKHHRLDRQGHLESLDDSTQRMDSRYNEDERERRMTSTPCIGLSTSTSSNIASLGHHPPKLHSPRLRPKKQNQAEETLRELEELEGQIEGNDHSGETGSTNQSRWHQDSYFQPGLTDHTSTHCHQPVTNGRAEASMSVDPGHAIADVLQQEPHDPEPSVGRAIDRSSPAVKETHNESVRMMSETIFQEQADEPTDKATGTVYRTRTAPRDEATLQDSSQQSSHDSDRDTDLGFKYDETAGESLIGGQPGKNKNHEPHRIAEMTFEGSEHNGCLLTKKDSCSELSTGVMRGTSQELVQPPAGLATVASTMVQTDWSLIAHGGPCTSGKNIMDKSVQWETPPSPQILTTPGAQRTAPSLSQQSSATTATPSPLEQCAPTSNLTSSKQKPLGERKPQKKPSPPLHEYKRKPQSMSFSEYSAGSVSALSQRRETVGISTPISCQCKALSPSLVSQPALSKQHRTAQFVSPPRKCTPIPCHSSPRHQSIRTSPCRQVKIILRSTSFTQHETTLILSPSQRHLTTSICSPFPRERTVFASSSSKHHLAKPQSFLSEQHGVVSNSSSPGRCKATSYFSLSQQLETASNYSPSPQPRATFRSSSHHKCDRKTASPAAYYESTPHSSSSQQHEATSNPSPSQYRMTKSRSPSAQSFQQHMVLTSFPYGQNKTTTPCPFSHHKQMSANWTVTPQRLKSIAQSAASEQCRVTPESQTSQQRIAVLSNSPSTKQRVVSTQLSSSEQHLDFPRTRRKSAVEVVPRESGRNTDIPNTFKLFETWEEAQNAAVSQKDAELPVHSDS